MECTACDMMVTEVITLDKAMLLEEAIAKMTHHRVHGAPVVHDGKVVGLLSERDIIALLDGAPYARFFKSHHSLREEAERVGAMEVKDAMDPDFEWLEPDDTVYDAARLLHETGQRILPVIRNGQLEGIITRSTILEHLVN